MAYTHKKSCRRMEKVQRVAKGRMVEFLDRNRWFTLASGRKVEVEPGSGLIAGGKEKVRAGELQHNLLDWTKLPSNHKLGFPSWMFLTFDTDGIFLPTTVEQFIKFVNRWKSVPANEAMKQAKKLAKDTKKLCEKSRALEEARVRGMREAESEVTKLCRKLLSLIALHYIYCGRYPVDQWWMKTEGGGGEMVSRPFALQPFNEDDHFGNFNIAAWWVSLCVWQGENAPAYPVDRERLTENAAHNEATPRRDQPRRTFFRPSPLGH